MLKKIAIVVFLCASIIFAQSREELNQKFDEAIKHYQNGNWSASLTSFNKIANDFKPNSKSSLAVLFIGKNNLELKNFDEAEKSLLRFSNEFSDSKYFDEANITLSKIYLEQEQFSKAFWLLCESSINSESSSTKNYINNSSEKIALKYLSAVEIKSIYDTTKLASIKPLLLLVKAKIYLTQGENHSALDALSNLINLFPNSEEVREAKKLYDSINLAKDIIENPEVIGIILPLSKNLPSSSVASEILEGIKYSLSEYNGAREKKIGILIRDSELSKNKLEEIHDEFKNVKNLKCIIGPIYSAEVKDALRIFKDVDVPIISPTATEDFLTVTNGNFFQANPSFTTRGRLMAQFAFFVENKRKIAILNAIDGYSPILSSSFAQEFEKLGGNIVLRETYKSGSTDLSEQINKISVVLNHIEGMYIPLADKIDIPVVVSFISQLELNVPIYGDQDWMTLSGLESAAFLNNKLIFCSDYFSEFKNLEYQNFSKNFYSKTKTDLNRNNLYGYDTMKYILTNMRTSFSGSNALKQKMMSGITSVGFQNNISFNSNRINRFLNIVRYSSGKFELIDKFKLNN